MHPRKKAAKAPAVAAAVPVPGPGAGIVGGIATHVELHAGEKDNANLAYIERLASAWDVIQDHDVFLASNLSCP